jgi:hypothetical protein
VHWWERLLDLLFRCYTRTKSFKSLQFEDFGRHQIWGFVKCDWGSTIGGHELFIRPLRLREYDSLSGCLLIGAVLKVKEERGLPGAVVARIEGNKVDVIGVVVFVGRFLAFHVLNGVVSELGRDSLLKDLPDMTELFPLNYETWVPIHGKLTRICGRIDVIPHP